VNQVGAKPWHPDRLAVLAIASLLVAGCSGETAGPATTDSVAAVTTMTESTTTLEATTTTFAAGATRITGDLSADALAVELTTVEQAAAQGDGTVGQRQQLLYRYLSVHADLDEAVLASIGDDVRPYVERIVRARQLGQARQAANTNPSPPSDTLPAWELVDPRPADELLADYHEAEAATGIGWYWLAAIHFQETRTGRIIGLSSAGAVGPMQFLPSTWAQCCVGDPTVDRDAMIGAATYLAQNGGPGDMHAALHTYNPNDSYVATVTAFAENMRDNPRLFNAYREWQVFYSTSAGTVRLPIGYSQAQPIDAAAYLADHPDDATA
jgi:membrane-bound lytic murein transglycosylase B